MLLVSVDVEVLLPSRGHVGHRLAWQVYLDLRLRVGGDALEEGSIIKCSVEKDSDGKDVVTEVWIVE